MKHKPTRLIRLIHPQITLELIVETLSIFTLLAFIAALLIKAIA